MQALYQLSYSPLRHAAEPHGVPPCLAGRTRRTLACDLPESEIRVPAAARPSVVVAEHRLRQGAGVVLEQAPAPYALAEDGPAAVGEPAEAFPVTGLQTEEAADGGADGAAV